MKNKILLLTLLVTGFGFSQVKDISFTFSPVANYTFWDDKAGLEDGVLYGGKLGFGFGEYLELRAVYLKSNDLKTDFSNYGLSNFNSNLYTPQKVDLTRWGGEFKANLSTARLSPYITFGTGVQNLAIVNGADFDQIYTSIGLGIKTRINDRIILNLEAKNTAYNFNSGKNLLTAADKTAFGVTDADFENNLLYNWSAQASLQFYLGGRKPGTLSDLDRAYLNKFRGGFSGLQWIVEPGASYVSFDDRSQFRDSYFLGGYAGLDFNRFTGIRAFYFQATENDQLSTSFDKLAMYGLEFRARLNDGNGVTPFLTLGGGYLNPESNYVSKDAFTIDKGQKFAAAGLGLNIPLSKNFLISGGVKGLVTSSSEIENLAGPEVLQTHIMYNAGLKLTFGKKSKNPDDIYEKQVNNALDEQDSIAQSAFNKRFEIQKAANQDKLATLEEKYTMQLDSLQAELKVATATNNIAKAIEVLEKKKETTQALNEVKEITKKTEQVAKPQLIIKKEIEVEESPTKTTAPKELIKMSPAELELLIEKILDKTEPTQYNSNPQQQPSSNNSNEVNQLNKRIDFLEKLILERDNQSSIEKKNKIDTQNEALSAMNLKIEELKLQSELNGKKIDLNNTPTTEVQKTLVIGPNGTVTRTSTMQEVVPETDSIPATKPGRFIENERTSSFSEKMDYKGTSVYVGGNFGEQTTPNIGLRFNYGFKNSNFEFVPEVYYGIANPNSFGLSTNFLYQFNQVSDGLTPYLGLGGGFSKIAGNTGLHHNIILGTNLKFLGGRLFADFTSRNFSENNQIALGYRFKF